MTSTTTEPNHSIEWKPTSITGYYTGRCCCGKEWTEPTWLPSLYRAMNAHKNPRPARTIYRPTSLEEPEYEG